MPPRVLRSVFPAVLFVFAAILLFLGPAPAPSALAEQPSATPDFKALCDTVLARAMRLTGTGCANTGRNEACYGYTLVQSKLQPGVDSSKVRFAESGDILPVRLLAALRTDPLDLERGTWGMALLKLQANLPDTNPGQNVTFVLFGDTKLTPNLNRTNAFYLSTALGELTCKQIPQNALVIRSPGYLQVTFNINGVEIKSSSIVVMRAGQSGLLVRTLEGHISVTAVGVTRTLVAGQQLTVPMKSAPEGLIADGPPGVPGPAPFEGALDPVIELLEKVNPGGRTHQGDVIVEGPVEILNPAVPSLTLYGRIVMLDRVSGWRGVRPGQWVYIEGTAEGIIIRARSLRVRRDEVPLAPTVTPSPGDRDDEVVTLLPYAGRPPEAPAVGSPATPGPGPDRITLTAMCSPDPGRIRAWRVVNPLPKPVSVNWDVYESILGQKGKIEVPALGEATFTTITEYAPNTQHATPNMVRLFFEEKQIDAKDSDPTKC